MVQGRAVLLLTSIAVVRITAADPQDCVQNGGQATCVAPLPVWEYMLCDDAAAYVSRSATWCRVMGGTWHGPYAPVPCEGGDQVLTEPKLYPYAASFERQIHNVQSCRIDGQDGGWLAPGQTINSWNCWSGGPVLQNGVEVSNLREMLFSGQSYNANTGQCDGNWAERVVARRDLRMGCPDGYTKRIGTNGQTECFTIEPPSCHIRLSGFPAEVEPGKAVQGLVATVTCVGKSPAGIPVTITPDVIAYTGGHQHDEGRRPQHAGTIALTGGSGSITDQDGQVQFAFTAPAPAGDHTVTARCADNNCGEDVGAVWVGVKGLQSIGSGPWKLVGRTDSHPSNHYLRSDALGVMTELAATYKLLFVDMGRPPASVLHLNDASLERGGIFDIQVSWTSPHSEHCRGAAIDVRANDEDGAIPEEARRDFEDIARELGADPFWEVPPRQIPYVGNPPNWGNRHYHLRLLGAREGMQCPR